MTDPRLDPPFWRHDAFTLKRLSRALTALARSAREGPNPPSTVVDLGAGEAPYRALFEQGGCRYLPCDIDVPVDHPTTHRLEPGQPSTLASGSADVVLSLQVLEHVWDIDWYLGEARRLLAPDGRLILSTHGTWLYHPHPTDFRRWTRTGLLAEIEQRGFKVVQVQALVGPLAWTTQFRALGWNRVLAAVPLLGGLLAMLSNSVMHLRMQLEDALTPRQWIEDNAAIYLVVARTA